MKFVLNIFGIDIEIEGEIDKEENKEELKKMRTSLIG